MTIKKHCTRAVALDLRELTDQSLHNNDVVHGLVELLRERGSSLQFLSLVKVDASPYSEDIIRELCEPPLCQTLRALHMAESLLSTPDEADVYMREICTQCQNLEALKFSGSGKRE